MSNQNSVIPFGTDATKYVGYLFAANDRLGSFDLQVENIGANTLFFKVMEQTNPSGAFIQLGNAITVVPSGTKTLSFNLVSQKIAFFGSGNTVANVSYNIRNKGNLRGAQADIVIAGNRGWGVDPNFQSSSITPVWGNPDTLL